MVAGLALVRPLFLALRDSEAHIRRMMDGVPDAIFVSDPEGWLVDTNRQAEISTGYDRKTLLTMNALDIDIGFTGDSAAAVWDILQDGKPLVFESLHRRRDGSTFPVEVSLTALTTGGRHLILGVIRDISERRSAAEIQKRAIEQLTRSHAELERFTYVATHDLQEPLRLITTYAQRLDREFGDRLSENGRDYLDFVVRGAKRMRDLVNALLVFSRTSLKATPFGPVDFERVVGAALATLGSSLDESGARVCLGELPPLNGDEMQISLMVQHLLSNAVKYRKDGRSPTIRLGATLHQDRGEWELEVTDDGIGIEPEYHDLVFLPFKRLHTQDAFPGTGVGLALCRGIAERHGGRITLASTPGAGCTFRVTLPLA